MSLAIVAVIVISTWGLLRDSINLAVDAVPKGIDMAGIRHYLSGLDNVSRIHDLHVWPLSTTEVALTVHLVVTDDSIDNHFLIDLQQHLQERFGIEHATIQVEKEDDKTICMLDKQCI